MNTVVVVAADLVAIGLLIAVYFRRHRRRDLIAAYLCVNLGVLAVTQVLSTSTVGAGLGLGLFGVLSIIRLRSSELAQHEIAYYFAALALGLLAGFQSVGWLAVALMGLIVVGLYVADHPRLLHGYRQQVVVLDRAMPDEAQLRAHLSALLGATVTNVTVRRLDLVNDSTAVDVRYRIQPTPARRGGAPAALAEPPFAAAGSR
jgi:hypothetical protein